MVNSIHPVTFLDFQFSGKDQIQCKIPANHSSLLYVYKGNFILNNNDHDDVNVGEGYAVVYEISKQQGIIQIENKNNAEAGIIVLSGQPINETIVQHGPFVMNSKQEIQQTFEDYSYGQNGFENSRNWESQIQNLRYKTN